MIRTGSVSLTMILLKLSTLYGPPWGIFLKTPEEIVREDELRDLSGYTGNGRGRQPTPAYPARQEDDTVAPRAETPAPNGGGNGRCPSRARRAQRRASPGVRSTASNGTKGKGKGKFDSREM